MNGAELSGNSVTLNSGLPSVRVDTSLPGDVGPLDLLTGVRKEIAALQFLSSAKPLDNEAFWGAILHDLDVADLKAVSPALA